MILLSSGRRGNEEEVFHQLLKPTWEEYEGANFRSSEAGIYPRSAIQK